MRKDHGLLGSSSPTPLTGALPLHSTGELLSLRLHVGVQKFLKLTCDIMSYIDQILAVFSWRVAEQEPTYHGV